MKRVVSFSLWGSDPKYCIGAIRNAALCREYYPEWIPRYYIGDSVPKNVVRDLISFQAEIVNMKEPGDWRGLFWRFYAIADMDVGVMISRDCDSRISEREVMAVNDWLNSDYLFHIMRDHPAHSRRILGGMWGVKAPLLKDIRKSIDNYVPQNRWQSDQDFLSNVIYPKIKKYALIHDEIFENKQFPTPRKGYEFVGQVFDHRDRSRESDKHALESALNRSYAMKLVNRFKLFLSINS